MQNPICLKTSIFHKITDFPNQDFLELAETVTLSITSISPEFPRSSFNIAQGEEGYFVQICFNEPFREERTAYPKGFKNSSAFYPFEVIQSLWKAVGIDITEREAFEAMGYKSIDRWGNSLDIELEEIPQLNLRNGCYLIQLETANDIDSDLSEIDQDWWELIESNHPHVDYVGLRSHPYHDFSYITTDVPLEQWVEVLSKKRLIQVQ